MNLLNKTRLQCSLGCLLVVLLVIAGPIYWIYTQSYGLLLGGIAWGLALGVVKRWLWAYFGTAVWALACYQLAKEGLDFQAIKSWVMALALPLLVLSLYLHEVQRYRTRKLPPERGSDSSSKSP